MPKSRPWTGHWENFARRYATCRWRRIHCCGTAVTTRLNGAKGTLLEGGIRVPGIIEWPRVVRSQRTTAVPCVTSDILPTICELVELPLPDRPLDGISLVPLIHDTLRERPSPIAFWKYSSRDEKDNGRWLDAALQKGTTPTVRNPGIDFLNFRHPVARTENFPGQAAMMENRYKLIVDQKGAATLFDIVDDPYEKNDLAGSRPQDVTRLRTALQAWQASVERSLTGADYDR